MARSDYKTSRSRGRTWSDAEYHAHLRSQSKRSYDWLSSKDGKQVDELSDSKLLQAYNNMNQIASYGKLDWERYCENLSEDRKNELESRIDDIKERQKEENKRSYEKSKQEKEERYETEFYQLHQQAELISGIIQSDFHSAVDYIEVWDRSGEDLDDPVEMLFGGDAFVTEDKVSTGIKLQITISIDLSNSMRMNNVDEVALKEFKSMILALENLKQEFPGSLYFEGFYFSQNRDGLGSGRIREPYWSENKDKDYYLGKLEKYRDGSSYSLFTGEDTYLHPLLLQLQNWEKKESEEGCYKLDIILSDAVFEHPKDLKLCNEIQLQRNGALQTVILNFLDPKDWKDVNLPAYIVQYHVDSENTGATLRNILGEFLGVLI